jgi:hypothetical protein
MRIKSQVQSGPERNIDKKAQAHFLFLRQWKVYVLCPVHAQNEHSRDQPLADDPSALICSTPTKTT